MKAKIMAKVKFNDGIAIVLDKLPELTYRRIGTNVIYGTDGTFYKCYAYERSSPNWKAFAGRKFNLPMKDGNVTECYGQYWDAGQGELSEKLGITIEPVTMGTIPELIECYVFSGSNIESE